MLTRSKSIRGIAYLLDPAARKRAAGDHRYRMTRFCRRPSVSTAPTTNATVIRAAVANVSEAGTRPSRMGSRIRVRKGTSGLYWIHCPNRVEASDVGG